MLRGDRVVATVTSTQAVIPGSNVADRFFVRAADQRGNRSASTPVTVAKQAVQTTTLLPFGAGNWRFQSTGQTPASVWNTPRFDDSAWTSGTAPLGWGSSRVATTTPLGTDGRRAVVQYYRNSFQIPAGTTVGDVKLTTVADDGAVVYVNGTEIGRANVAAGTVTNSTYAQSAPSSTSAWSAPTTFTIPQSVLRQGANTIAISSHVMYRATPDSSVDATVIAETGTFSPPAVAAKTTLVKEAATWDYLFSSTVQAPSTWTTSTDGTQNWKSGAAPLGWGTSGPISTNIDVAAGETRGLTSYFRNSFTVDDPSAFASLALTSRADDGVAIYVNGVEVNRTRLPSGALNWKTYASSAVSTQAALAAPIVLDLPASLLQSGTNSVAVEVHSNSRNTANTSMALELVGIAR